MEKMLVTEGLKELKTLDGRIQRAIGESNFIDSAKTSEKNVSPSYSKDDLIKEARASYQSINDLVERRSKIKAAIIESNAKTMVEICGETMFVAHAIELKDSILYKKFLLTEMRDQYNEAVAKMNRNNASMEAKIDQLVTTAFGKESKTKINDEDYNAIAVPYRNANEYSLVDPLSLKKEIDGLQNYIEEFESTVDSKLQISNCITIIEF